LTSVASGTVTVRIPPQLLNRTGQRRVLKIEAGTVRELIDELEKEHPGLRFNICHETGELRPYVNIFVGAEDVRYQEGLETRLTPGETVHIFHSVAGG